jgi:hypothetical protein
MNYTYRHTDSTKGFGNDGTTQTISVKPECNVGPVMTTATVASAVSSE